MKFKGKINHDGTTFDEKFAKCKSDDLPMLTALYRTVVAVIAPGSKDANDTKTQIAESIRIGYGLSLISSVSVFAGIHDKETMTNPSMIVESMLKMAEDEGLLMRWTSATHSIIESSTVCICSKCFTDLEKEVLANNRKNCSDGTVVKPKIFTVDKKTKKMTSVDGEDLPYEVVEALEKIISKAKNKKGNKNEQNTSN